MLKLNCPTSLSFSCVFYPVLNLATDLMLFRLTFFRVGKSLESPGRQKMTGTWE